MSKQSESQDLSQDLQSAHADVVSQNASAPIKWKKPFFTISSGQLFSLIGSSAVQFALIWWLAKETDSPRIMALAGLAAFLPQLFLGPFAGVWIDRLKRKWVIIGADLFIGVTAATFAFIMLVWNVPPWSVCVILGVRGIGNVFHTPAIQAVVPMLVPKEKIVMANGISQFMQSGAFLLGPVLGALLYSVLPMWIILLSDLVGALIAVIAVAIVKIPELPPKKEKLHFFRDLKEGFSAILQDRKLTVITFAIFLGFICFMPLTSYYPLMTSSYFGGNEFHGSVVEVGFAVGMLIGAGLVGGIGVKKNKLGFTRIMIILMGAVTLASGLLPSGFGWFWVFAVLCAGMGGFMNAFNIPYMAHIQESIAKETQGRVFALVGSLTSLAMPLGLLISGPVAERFGIPFWFFISGAILMGVMLLSYLFTLKSNKSKPPKPAKDSDNE